MESGKTPWVNFKNAVYHASFFEIIKSALEGQDTGTWFKCADGIDLWIFVVLLIISADYEEL